MPSTRFGVLHNQSAFWRRDDSHFSSAHLVLYSPLSRLFVFIVFIFIFHRVPRVRKRRGVLAILRGAIGRLVMLVRPVALVREAFQGHRGRRVGRRGAVRVDVVAGIRAQAEQDDSERGLAWDAVPREGKDKDVRADGPSKENGETGDGCAEPEGGKRERAKANEEGVEQGAGEDLERGGHDRMSG